MWPFPPPLCTTSRLLTSSESHSCWGPLFEPTTGGLTAPHNPSPRVVSSLCRRLQFVTVAFDVDFSFFFFLKGSNLPRQLQRLVNGSTQADHLSAPRVDLWRGAYVSCCLLLSQKNHIREKATRNCETECRRTELQRKNLGLPISTDAVLSNVL